MKAIETEYNGYLFRSRLEARWAVLFDGLGIAYQYEPEGFDLDGVWYLPDFWLPEYDCWVEIKPEEPNVREVLKCQRLARIGGKPVYLMYGDIWYDLGLSKENGMLFDSAGRFQAQFYWTRCLNCGKLAISSREVIPFSDGTACAPMIGSCGCERAHAGLTWEIQAAYTAARQARFEHLEAIA
jgi:hypothetical protein